MRVHHLAVATVLPLLAACAWVQPDQPEVGSGWQLTAGTAHAAPIPLSTEHRITLFLQAEGISGSAGCNSYGADVTRSGQTIAVGNLFRTQRGCDPGAVDAERAYLDAVSRVTALAESGNELRAIGPGVELQFTRLHAIDPARLAGTRWTLTEIESSGVAGPALAPAELVLAADGTFTGDTGCRTLSGTWATSFDALGMPALDAGTECGDPTADPGARQDGLVLSVLGDGPRVVLDGDRLRLDADGGLSLVYRAAAADGAP